MAAYNPKLKLRLLIDKKSQKVLFAEADKEFVDFLFRLLSLPLSSVVRLLSNHQMGGGIADLYGSIVSLDQTFIESSQSVDSILNSEPSELPIKSPILLTNDQPVNRNQVSECAYKEHTSTTTRIKRKTKIRKVKGNSDRTLYHSRESDVSDTEFARCGRVMSHQLQVVSNEIRPVDSYVKGVATYMVMDNLQVKPLSNISPIAFLDSFDVQCLSSLQEMVIDIGVEEGLKLLQFSLETKDVLTSLLFGKRKIDNNKL